MALTTLAIKNLKPKEALYLVADGGGLHLAVSPAGGKLWRFRYRFNGRQQVASLGKWPEITLEQARRLRDEAKSKLADGKHLTREKKAEKLRRTAEGENTFERVATSWMALKGQKLNEKYAKQTLARLEEHVFPHIGALPITEITIPDVVRVIEKIGEKGIIETAHRMKQNMSQIFRYAGVQGQDVRSWLSCIGIHYIERAGL